MPLTLSKEERLCSKRLIDRLYADGHHSTAFPFSMQWRVEPELNVPCQVLVVAPKRKFHHAVDRNRVKRLTRECYRRLKPQLYDNLAVRNMRITLAFVYIHTDILSYDKLYQKMERAIATLDKELENEKSFAAVE